MDAIGTFCLFSAASTMLILILLGTSTALPMTLHVYMMHVI